MYGNLIKSFAAIAILFFVATFFLDWDKVYKAITEISPLYFVIAVIVIIPEHILLAWRWYLIVRNNVPLTFKVHLRRFLISIFLNSFAPGSVGGDLYRFLVLRKKSTDHWILAGTIIRERIIGVTGFSVFYLICYLLYNSDANITNFSFSDPFDIGAITLTVGLIGLIPAYYLTKIALDRAHFSEKTKTNNILRVVVYSLDPGNIKWALLMLSISMVVCCLWTFCIFLIGIKIPVFLSEHWTIFFVFGMVGILTELIRSIPITLQGIGVREGIFAYLLTFFGASFDQAFVLGAATYIAVSISILFAGIIGFIIPSQNNEN